MALVIVIVVAVAGAVVGFFVFFGTQSPTPAPVPVHWPEIPPESVMGVIVDYDSDRAVQSEADVEAVYNEYICYCQENNLGVAGSRYGNNWKFESASPYGEYEETRYWKVTASWFDEDEDLWRLIAHHQVSENGEVVRLLGAI